ncbi:MAG: aldo/keto reductase [Bacteroidota bacterium]
MKTRSLGNSGTPVTEVGLGCWQFGGDWGAISEDRVFELLETAVNEGIRFFDTADIYGGGRSESLLGRFFQGKSDEVFFATKLGRDPGLYPDKYTKGAIRERIEGSLQRLNVSSLGLIQLHCIPMEEMQKGEIFEWLREFQQEGLIQNFGASVESMDEALVCLAQEGIGSLQIIFNIFRQKPINLLFDKAEEKSVGIIVRLPLASGLLAGKFTAETTFEPQDHRTYNRNGEKFNVGETFAGLPFEYGVSLSDQLKYMVPETMTMAQFAMRWILDFSAVTVIIPGATKVQQVIDNARTSDLDPLGGEVHLDIEDFYKAKVEAYIRGPY